MIQDSPYRGRSSREVLADALKNPEVSAEWERTAVPRALSLYLLSYRIDRNLTQTAFARLLGISQPAYARLESGEHVPTLATLAKLSKALGVGFRIELRPDSAISEDGYEMVDLPTDIKADLEYRPENDQLQSAAD